MILTAPRFSLSRCCGVTSASVQVVPSGGNSRPDQVQGEGPKLIDKDLLSSSRERDGCVVTGTVV